MRTLSKCRECRLWTPTSDDRLCWQCAALKDQTARCLTLYGRTVRHATSEKLWILAKMPVRASVMLVMSFLAAMLRPRWVRYPLVGLGVTALVCAWIGAIVLVFMAFPAGALLACFALLYFVACGGKL